MIGVALVLREAAQRARLLAALCEGASCEVMRVELADVNLENWRASFRAPHKNSPTNQPAQSKTRISSKLGIVSCKRLRAVRCETTAARSLPMLLEHLFVRKRRIASITLRAEAADKRTI